MGKPIQIGQSHNLISILANNVQWDQVDSDLVQRVFINNPREAGKLFTTFLQTGGKMILPGLCVATALLNAEEFIGKKWKILPEEQDKRSAELTEVDLSKADFVTCLTPKETRIAGEEKLSRFKMEKGWIRYGATVFMGLWKDYQTNKENGVLERLYQQKGITYLDFFGDILEDPNGNRNVLYLYRNDDGTWNWNYNWLDNDWNASNLSAVSVSPQLISFLSWFFTRRVFF